MIGASGTIGSRIFDLLNNSERHKAIRFEGDITKIEDIDSCLCGISRLDLVINSAAIVELDTVAEDLDRALEVNCAGSAFILSALVAKGIEVGKYLYVSSSHVYSPSVNAIAETARCDPSSQYGVTKLGGEKVSQALCQRFSIPLVVARVFSVFDERQKGSCLYSSWRRRVAGENGMPSITVHNGASIRDFSHGSEVAAALVKLIDTDFEGTVNIGSERVMSVVEFLHKYVSSRVNFDAIGEGDKLIPNLDALKNLLKENK